MTREETRHKIEVHVAGICFRETERDIEVLIVKRRDDRELFPGKWECGGGQVYAGENFEEAVRRQMEQELGVRIDRVLAFGTYEIDITGLDQKKIPGIKFVCFLDRNEPYLDGKEPRLDPKEHSEWKWQSINSLSEIDFAGNIRNDIRIGWDFYANNQNIING